MKELFGYVGPSAGLTMIGALLAVLAVVILGLLGPILYPIRLIFRWRRNRKAAETKPHDLAGQDHNVTQC